jgi:hypothetical protein
MRDELLNETLFFELDDARAKIAVWIADYNQQRPHSSLRFLTPAAYAANFTATNDRLRNPDQIRRAPVAPHRATPGKTRRGSNRRWMTDQWQVKWQVSSAVRHRPPRLLAHTRPLVVGEVVHDDDGAGAPWSTKGAETSS